MHRVAGAASRPATLPALNSACPPPAPQVAGLAMNRDYTFVDTVSAEESHTNIQVEQASGGREGRRRVYLGTRSL